MTSVRLDKFVKKEDVRTRSRMVELAWLIIQALVVSSWQPSSWLRVKALVLFGARIGAGVVIKPGVRVKFPWKLQIAEHSWIGEQVWIDNLEEVSIGSQCCVSQGAYLCTGNHNWQLPTFDLVTRRITLEDGCWLGAFTRVAPGVVVGEEAVLTMGSIATKSLDASTVYSGNPATAIGQRIVQSD